ncbi:MAG: hypothetical protein U0133_18685 [Gemmatimonadales bacterium]
MTIVIALKVGEGVVLGADSASTYTDGAGGYHNSYFNAEKLFNLAKDFPIGAVTFGLGSLGSRSVSSHAKDLRQRFGDSTDQSWYLDRTNYTMKDVCDRVRRFFYEELYKTHVPAGSKVSAMGFIVAGYSANADTAEIWRILIKEDGSCGPSEEVSGQSQDWSITWEGQPEACYRLVRGWSPEIIHRLVAAGMTEQDAIQLCDSVQPLIHPTMPIQDSIDLVDYLIEVTCGYVRFAPGPATVAKPIDTAAITKHEGFRWVHRKHYYKRDLNLPHP